MIINERYIRIKDKGTYYGAYSTSQDPKFNKDTNSKNNGITINVNQYRKLDKDARRQTLNHENRHKEQFNYAKYLPHTWSEDKRVRYFANNISDMKQISDELSNSVGFIQKHLQSAEIYI